MLSRVAESVYWMFRYMERAQNTARFIDSDFNTLLYKPVDRNNIWQSLVAVTGDTEFFESKYKAYTRDQVIEFLTLDTEYLNSILSCLTSARENARSIRESISSEMWEEVNTMYLRMKDYAQSPQKQDPYELCRAIVLAGHVFTGLFYSTMNRTEAWHFARMGMLLERADKTSRILDVKYFILLPQVSYVGTAYDNMQWAALLKSASALEMYRKKYKRIDPKDVTDFLIFDQHFPRSIRHCLRYAEESLLHIARATGTSAQNSARDALVDLISNVLDTSVEEVLEDGLHSYLDTLQGLMNRVDDQIRQMFFEQKAFLMEEVLYGAQSSAQS